MKYLLFLIFSFLSISLSAQYRLVYLTAEPEGSALEGLNLSKSVDDSLQVYQAAQIAVSQLQSRGYLAAYWSDLTFEQKTAYVKIITGEKYEWVYLKPGNVEESLLSKSGYRDRFFRDKVFSYTEVADLFESVISISENGGYPFANIRLDSMVIKDSKVAASIAYEPGPLIHFDTLQLSGNTKTKRKFLSAYLAIKQGEPYDQRKVDQAMQRLARLPYLRIQKVPEQSFQNSESTLYLEIDDRRINQIDGIIGLLPNELEENKVLITGQFNLALYNLGGAGRNLNIAWQRLSQLSQNLNLLAEESNIFGSPVSLKANFFLLKEDSSFTNRNFRFDISYRPSAHARIGFFTSLRAANLLSTFQYREATELPDLVDFDLNQYGINYQLSYLDDDFNPFRGWQSEVEFAVGNKNIRRNTGIDAALYEGVDLQTLQLNVHARLERFTPLSRRTTLLTRITGGFMANDRLFVNDLYRVGGLKSIRGFNENFFFASEYALLNVESRFYFDEFSYFLVFFDQAYIKSDLKNRNFREYPFGTGLGISLSTAGGIFNFIYGLGKAEAQPFGLNYSKIHFGYISRF